MFKTKFEEFVAFLKLSFAEGLVKTAKNDIFNTLVLSGVLVVSVVASTLVFSGDTDSPVSANTSYEKPFGEFVADYGYGDTNHFLSKKEFSSYTFSIEDGKEKRFYLMKSPIKSLKDASASELMVFQGRKVRNGISFIYKDQGVEFKVVIADVELKSGYSYMIAKYKTTEPAHKAVFTKLTY